jgi:shikimate kinase
MGEKMNIIIIGFMGSGKSTLGKHLSKELGLKLIDMDRDIERKQNKSINEIFRHNGEKYFRTLETNYLKDLLNIENTIISTGGGVILKEENVELLHKIGKVIFLHAHATQILENLKNDTTRPLLQTDNYEQKVKELLEEREGIYLNAADIIIQTKGKDINSVVNEIITIL